MEQKLTAIAENSVALHEKCVRNHFTATVTGDGSQQLTFSLPFQPDALWIVCTDPILRVQDNLVGFFNVDFRALGLLCAVSQCSNSGAYYNMAMTNTSVFSRYSMADDGTVTVQNVSARDGYGVFGAGLPYVIIAVKYAEKTDKVLFTELIERLTGSGTLQVWGEKVHAAFTDEEWNNLTATKPDWTFEEV